MGSIDLNTARGAAEWMRGLPTENLREIASRPLDSFNYLLVTAAEGELIVREDVRDDEPPPGTRKLYVGQAEYDVVDDPGDPDHGLRVGVD
jgi:hypothetical protein